MVVAVRTHEFVLVTHPISHRLVDELANVRKRDISLPRDPLHECVQVRALRIQLRLGLDLLLLV